MARKLSSEKHHSSRWGISDLRKEGYTVRGVGFSFFGLFATYRLAFALAPVAYYSPWMGYTLLAWKNLNRKIVQDENSASN